MSNFDFLKNEWPEFFQWAAKAEKLVITDPRTSLTYARMALEVDVNWMYSNDPALKKPYNATLKSLFTELECHFFYRGTNINQRFSSGRFRGLD